jgi:hypothetical protein
LDFTTQKLEGLWREQNEFQGECSTVRNEFDRERNDMYDTIYELSNQLKLKQLIIEQFIPPEDSKKIEKMCDWNEEINDWVIRTPGSHKEAKASKRP